MPRIYSIWHHFKKNIFNRRNPTIIAIGDFSILSQERGSKYGYEEFFSPASGVGAWDHSSKVQGVNKFHFWFTGAHIRISDFLGNAKVFNPTHPLINPLLTLSRIFCLFHRYLCVHKLKLALKDIGFREKYCAFGFWGSVKFLPFTPSLVLVLARNRLKTRLSTSFVHQNCPPGQTAEACPTQNIVHFRFQTIFLQANVFFLVFRLIGIWYFHYKNKS